MAKVIADGIRYYSKHRNGKSKALDIRDASGKKINGSVFKHYMNIARTNQDKANLIKEYEDIPVSELKTLHKENKQYRQAYFNVMFNTYDKMELEDLNSLTKEDLLEVELEALERCIELKELSKKIKIEKDGEREESNTEDINQTTNLSNLPLEGIPQGSEENKESN